MKVDVFCNSRLCIHQIELAAHIRKSIPGAMRSFLERPSYGVIYKLSGSTYYRFTQNGEPFLLEPGSVLYLPRGCSYTAVTREAGECIAVNFTGSLQLPEGCHQSRPFICQAGSLKMENLFRHLYECYNARLQPDARCEYMAFSLLYEIFQTLCTQVSPAENRVGEAVDLMYSRIGDPTLKITDLAEITGLSLSHFRKVFTKTYGIAPVRYLLLLRVAHARKLLVETRMSVREVAEATGFSDVYYFSRTFTKASGVSPTAYRRRTEISF